MTFLTNLDDPTLSGNAKPSFGLSQRGRSSVEILGSIQQFSAGKMRPAARAEFEADPATLPLAAEHKADTEGKTARARIAKARAIADTKPLFRLERFLQRWVAEEVFGSGIPAIEERRAQFEAFQSAPLATSAGGTLDITDQQPPRYWQTEWHLEPGGWDGYDLYSPMFAFAVGPYVFSKGGYAAVGVGDDIAQQRIETVKQFPKSHYQRIFEPGCGGATTFRALHSVFPDAELHGADLSPGLLKAGHRMAESQGIPAHLKQRDITQTGEPDAHYDAVITYALHHELPPKENAKLFAELFRIMKPGADIILSDPPPFRVVDLFHAVILDWDTDNRGEPFFSAVLHSSLDEQLRDAGFTQVESYPLGQDWYPWITRARKPLEAPLQQAA
jgi:SAM-dependent methyltransferase